MQPCIKQCDEIVKGDSSTTHVDKVLILLWSAVLSVVFTMVRDMKVSLFMSLTETISGSKMCIIVQAKKCSTDRLPTACPISFHWNMMLILFTTSAFMVI